MKNLKFYAFLFLLSSFISSCVNEENNIFELNEHANVESLREVVKTQTSFNKKTKFSKRSNLNEDEAKVFLEPIINETVSVLLNSGISENEIITEFGSLNSPEIALMSVALLNENSSYNTENQSKKERDVIDCAARAFTGIKIHEGFWNSFTNRRVLLRAVGKLATRTLGFVGAALVVYEFADCMWGQN